MPPKLEYCIPEESNQKDAKVSSQTIQKMLLPPTIALPLLVMIDMLSVSLVVPLLFQYYKAAGVTSASQRELLSSLFSSSQIIGGLLLGFIADSGLVHRRTILFISFAGSAILYGLIASGGFRALIFSRILVGLVKQTMTSTTTMMAQCTTKEDRTKHMARLNASATVAWIVGPSLGGYLYKNVDPSSPPMLACCLFVVNLILTAVLIPAEEDFTETEKTLPRKASSWQKFSSFTSNLRSCFNSKELGFVVLSFLLFYWVNRATSYNSMASYYEEMYGIEPHQRGYLTSYQGILRFVVQSTLVGPLLVIIGGERRAAVLSAAVLAVATWMEIHASFPIFLIVLCPTIAVSIALMSDSLRSLVTHVAPKESLGSVLAAVDVLQNAAGVTVPFYRTILFNFMATDNDAIMKGDPNPRTWAFSSGLHWCGAAFIIGYFLLSSSGRQVSNNKKGKAV